jgi:hypothetical protein
MGSGLMWESTLASRVGRRPHTDGLPKNLDIVVRLAHIR